MYPFLRKINDVAPPGSRKDTNGKKSSTQWDLNPLLLIYKAQALPLCPQTELSSEWLVPSLSGMSETLPEVWVRFYQHKDWSFDL